MRMLDTNVLAALAGGEPSVLERFQLAQRAGEAFCVSAIVVGEARYGIAKRPESRGAVRTAALLDVLETKPWDQTIAATCGKVRWRQQRLGRQLTPNDTLIAAHAIALDATLVSDDRAFERVEGLKLENWLAPGAALEERDG